MGGSSQYVMDLTKGPEFQIPGIMSYTNGSLRGPVVQGGAVPYTMVRRDNGYAEPYMPGYYPSGYGTASPVYGGSAVYGGPPAYGPMPSYTGGFNPAQLGPGGGIIIFGQNRNGPFVTTIPFGASPGTGSGYGVDPSTGFPISSNPAGAIAPGQMTDRDIIKALLGIVATLAGQRGGAPTPGATTTSGTASASDPTATVGGRQMTLREILQLIESYLQRSPGAR